MCDPNCTEVNPLLAIRGLKGQDFSLSLAYIPSIQEEGKEGKYKLIDKQKAIPILMKHLFEMGEKHIWDVYMIEHLADEIEEAYKPLALYLLAKFYSKTDSEGIVWPEEIVSVIRGEMIKDWDLKLETLKLLLAD